MLYLDYNGLSKYDNLIKDYIDKNIDNIESISDDEIMDVIYPYNIISGITITNVVTEDHKDDAPVEGEYNVCTININNQLTFFYPDKNYNFIYKTKEKITYLTFKAYVGNIRYIDLFISLNLSNINTSNITNMSYMFSSNSNLISLNLSNFDTSNVTEMKEMFSGCNNIKSLDLSSFNTSNVTNMINMFLSCNSLENIDLRSFNTSNVTNIMGMFYYCYKITSLDLSNFDTRNVTSMLCLFDSCKSLTSLDLSIFDTSNVTDMCSMFRECTSLTSLDLSNFNTSNVSDMHDMFSNCTKLASLDLSNFDTSNVTDMRRMFSFTSLTYIKCKTAFRDWCWSNKNTIELPSTMQEGGTGTWDLID